MEAPKTKQTKRNTDCKRDVAAVVPVDVVTKEVVSKDLVSKDTSAKDPVNHVATQEVAQVKGRSGGSAKVKVKRREPEFRSADMLQSFSYVCRMFHFGSSHLFQPGFCEYEPNQNETDHETNVETRDSEEFLSCDEGFDDVFEEFESESNEDSFLNSFGTTFCQENHGTSGHMDWEYHVGRTSSGQAERKCSCEGTFVDPCFRMMRGFPQVEDLTQDEDLDGPVLEPQNEGSSVGSPSLAATVDLVQPHETRFTTKTGYT